MNIWETIQPILVVAFLCGMVTVPIITFWLVRTKDSPWNTTSWSRTRRMLELAELQPSEVVYDLGAGDGRILIVAAKYFGATGVGVEIDSLRCALIRVLVRFNGLGKSIRVICGDMFEQDISDADVVAVYLIPPTMQRIKDMMQTQLSLGTRIVSHRFRFSSWNHVTYLEDENVYLYIVDPQYYADSAD